MSIPNLNDESEFILAALPELRQFSGRPTSADLDQLPGCAAVFLFAGPDGAPIQLATTQHLRRLAESRLLDLTRFERGKADLAEIVRSLRWRAIAHPFEGRWWYYRLARRIYPREYRKLIAFGPASFLHLNRNDSLPELRIRDDIWCQPGHFVGPFPGRAAALQAQEGLWDLFDLCRYPEQVRKAPLGRRCAYADMGRCDAPCDGSVPVKHLIERTLEAWQFANGAISDWIDAAKLRMKKAAAEQKFELAGMLKRQLDCAGHWKTAWSANAVPAERLELLLILPVTRRKAHRLMLFVQGELVEGPIVARRHVPQMAGDFVASEVPAIRARLAGLDPGVRMEQTWLLSHLLFSRESEGVARFDLESVARPEFARELDSALTSRKTSAREPTANDSNEDFNLTGTD